MGYFIPRSLKGKLFIFLTFVNVGVSSFFAANDFIQQTVFSGLTALICFVMWYRELSLEDFRE
jgi:hypothetical protein